MLSFHTKFQNFRLSLYVITFLTQIHLYLNSEINLKKIIQVKKITDLEILVKISYSIIYNPNIN